MVIITAMEHAISFIGTINFHAAVCDKILLIITSIVLSYVKGIIV